MFPSKTRTSLEVLSTQGNQNDLSKRSNSTPLLLHYFMLNEERERKILRLLRSQTSLVGAQWAWSCGCCETVGTALTFSNLDIKPCALCFSLVVDETRGLLHVWRGPSRSWNVSYHKEKAINSPWGNFYKGSTVFQCMVRRMGDYSRFRCLQAFSVQLDGGAEK